MGFLGTSLIRRHNHFLCRDPSVAHVGYSSRVFLSVCRKMSTILLVNLQLHGKNPIDIQISEKKVYWVYFKQLKDRGLTSFLKQSQLSTRGCPRGLTFINMFELSRRPNKSSPILCTLSSTCFR